MKSILAEKLMHICGTDEDGYGIDNLTARQLKSVETALIKHLKFDRIEWMDLPTAHVVNFGIVAAQHNNETATHDNIIHGELVKL